MDTTHFSIGDAWQVDLVDFLSRMGYSPRKIRGNDYWYLSPLRNEKEPSFKVNRQLNVWYDHGIGKGGSLIDFGILYHSCSLKEFLEKINGYDFSFHRNAPPENALQLSEEERKIKVTDIKPITAAALLFYLKERHIPMDIAAKYCREVDYELYGKKYYAIGFKNNSGGFELRNQHFKASSSPKDSTVIQTEGATSLTVVEGFFSFLSLRTINERQPEPPTDYLVLNSLAFIGKNIERMQTHSQTILMLDNDTAGDKATSKLLEVSPSFKDNRQLYKGYKDLNHWLTETSKGVKEQQQKANKPSINHTHRRARGIH